MLSERRDKTLAFWHDRTTPRTPQASKAHWELLCQRKACKARLRGCLHTHRRAAAAAALPVMMMDAAQVLSAVKNGSAVPISPKNRYIFFSLPNFKKSAEEVSGPVDAWLYLLNHAADSDKLPNFGSDIIEEAIDRIRVDNADEELLSDQENAMSMKEDYEIILASTEIRARQEGETRGELKKAREMAKALKAMDIPVEKIAVASGLTVAEVEAL